MTLDTLLSNLRWLGHDAFHLAGEIHLYTDPWRIKGGTSADLILITHDHFDHCSPFDIAKIATADTRIVAPSSCVDKLKKHSVISVKAGDRLNVCGIDIEVVPAYNLTRRFHPRWYGGVGFIFSIGHHRIYHAGDTDFIPEMKQIQADIALLPVGGTYTMDAFEAAQAVQQIQPKVAIPMHYASPVVGYRRDARRFKERSDVWVEILPESPEYND